MKKRTLALRREALIELHAEELGDVVGANGTVTCTVKSVPLSECLLRTSPCPTQMPAC
jgi:hypothetical protein